MRSEPNPTQLERARLLLAHEGGLEGQAEHAVAAERVYDKLHAHLAPILGSAGVRALLARSVKLIRDRFPFLEVAVVESSTKLRECLQARESAVAGESAASLFGTFFALLTTFIGERLTTQVLRRAWPTIDDMAGTTAEKSK